MEALRATHQQSILLFHLSLHLFQPGFLLLQPHHPRGGPPEKGIGVVAQLALPHGLAKLTPPWYLDAVATRILPDAVALHSEASSPQSAAVRSLLYLPRYL